MTEGWAVAIMTLAVGWAAWEIRQLRQQLEKFVVKEDCRDDMHQHCDRLDTLDERITKNEKALESLKAKAEVWHHKEK